MKKLNYSIKKQLAFVFICLMTVTLLLCWIINNIFLQRYYEGNREKAILETYHLIDKATGYDRLLSEDFLIQLEKISGRYNIMGVVQDLNGIIVGTFGNDVEMLKGLLWDRLYMPIQNSQVLDQQETYSIQKVMDSKTKTEFMEMVGTLTGGQAFYMRTPLENIRESVDIANRFLLYVGLLGVVLSSVIIWFVSKKITEPILELAHISERMTRLDFEAKYSGKSRNEIAILGDNINILSATLEENIRELKTANNELMKDIEKKNEIDEMRMEFLSNVSHELKTPIALIQGYAEGLQEGISDDAESRKFYCDVIMDEASKMNQIVKKLLTLNELEFGNNVVSMERFDIVTLICNYLNAAKILTKQHEISVRMEHFEPTYVWADVFKVEEVFGNYFSNAVNHCSGDKIIDIRLEILDNKVKIIVFNTGEQIPVESISHIWDKFYKVDKARTRSYGGSGVGLSVVKAIMDSLNQKYGVENYDNGVAFWFELETVGKE
ncbi:MAG TPA: HAMP domain-containing sensor histidine kinase [Lachnospiraceae bacterium]|nr:HAMP domain-containing sensor histidine kinase [Lachnospiraceae bacterium]